MKVTLELDEEQAQVIMEALEMFARIRMGQFDVLHHNVEYRKERNYQHISEVERLLASLIFPDLKDGHYYGIPSSCAGERASTAWDVYQVIRHAVSWARNPEGGITVNYDPPMKVGKHPLPKINVDIESEEKDE